MSRTVNVRLSPLRLLTRVALMLLLSFTCVGASAGPVTQIVAPPDGFKLRSGRSVQVRVRIEPTKSPLRDWTLHLAGADGAEVEMARGAAAVLNESVATLGADALEAGSTYTLTLRAADASGAGAIAQSTIRVPDPQYKLIPLEARNLARGSEHSYLLDASGNVSIIGGRVRFGGELIIRDSTIGTVRRTYIDLGASSGLALSRDGSRLFYFGTFPGAGSLGVGYFDFATQESKLVERTDSTFFTVDRAGTRLAFQDEAGRSEDGRPIRQYYLFDAVSDRIRQLSSSPDAVVYYTDADKCPEINGTTPLITGDGRTVVLITASTLGLVAPNPDAGCRIFAYDTDQGALRHVIDLPRSISFGNPTLSANGRWLSFTSTGQVPPNIRRSFPALVDLETKTLVNPLGDIADYPSFDAVITGDGTDVVISTQADLDPRVGNADHTMDMFVYDRTSGRFTQISETTGGLGSHPGFCPSYEPRVNHDGRVILFGFAQVSGGGCQLDGTQRNEVDGFVFRFVRAVRKRPGNRGPEFEPPPSVRVVAGETLTMRYIATDPDSDPISFYIQIVNDMDVPPGSDIEDHHDGTATFTWPTKPENVGDYLMRVAAFDEGGGEVFHDFTITVAPEGRPADCAGDCNGDQRVTIEELVMGVNVALDRNATTSCRRLDTDQNARVTVDELVAATRRALGGCAG